MILTEKRHRKLCRLWFLYGNDGKKSTMGNHRYIQELIERTEIGEDVTKQIKKDAAFFTGKHNSRLKQALTQECIDAVNEILTNPDLE